MRYLAVTLGGANRYGPEAFGGEMDEVSLWSVAPRPNRSAATHSPLDRSRTGTGRLLAV